MKALAETAAEACGADNASLTAQIAQANTTAHAFSLAAEASIDLGNAIAAAGRVTAARVIEDAPIDVEVLLFNRTGSARRIGAVRS